MNQWLFLQINGWAGHNGLLDAIMLFCAQDLIYVVFAVTCAWLLLAWRRRTFRPAVLFLINLALAFGLLLVAAHLFIEQRPFVTLQVTQLLPHAPNQSFPSDHTTAACAIAFGFVLFTTWRKAGALLLLAALLIGFARVFVGIHYPGDIVGGVVIAAVASAIVFGGHRLWQSRRASASGQGTGSQKL